MPKVSAMISRTCSVSVSSYMMEVWTVTLCVGVRRRLSFGEAVAGVLCRWIAESQDACRHPADDGARWDVAGHHTACANHRVGPDGHALQDDGAGPDPDAIANPYRLGNQVTARQRMLVGIHDDDFAGDLAIAPDRDLRCRNDLRAAIQVGAVANPDQRALPALDAHPAEERTVFDFNAAEIGDARKRQPAHHDDDSGALKVAPQPPPQNVGHDALFGEPPAHPLHS